VPASIRKSRGSSTARQRLRAWPRPRRYSEAEALGARISSTRSLGRPTSLARRGAPRRPRDSTASRRPGRPRRRSSRNRVSQLKSAGVERIDAGRGRRDSRRRRLLASSAEISRGTASSLQARGSVGRRAFGSARRPLPESRCGRRRQLGLAGEARWVSGGRHLLDYAELPANKRSPSRSTAKNQVIDRERRSARSSSARCRRPNREQCLEREALAAKTHRSTFREGHHFARDARADHDAIHGDARPRDRCRLHALRIDRRSLVDVLAIEDGSVRRLHRTATKLPVVPDGLALSGNEDEKSADKSASPPGQPSSSDVPLDLTTGRAGRLPRPVE